MGMVMSRSGALLFIALSLTAVENSPAQSMTSVSLLPLVVGQDGTTGSADQDRFTKIGAQFNQLDSPKQTQAAPQPLSPITWVHLVVIIVAAGTLGGAVSASFQVGSDSVGLPFGSELSPESGSEHDDLLAEKPSLLRLLPTNIITGIGAAVATPAFLALAQSRLVRNIVETGDWVDALSFFGFCLAAAISSRPFLRRFSGQFISRTDFRDMAQRVKTADQRAERAETIAKQAQDSQTESEGPVPGGGGPSPGGAGVGAGLVGLAAAAVTSDVADTEEDEATEPAAESGREIVASGIQFVAEGEGIAAGRTVEAEVYATAVLMVLAGSTRLHNVDSLRRPTGLGSDQLQATINTLVAQGFVEPKATYRGTHWRITQAGRDECWRLRRPEPLDDIHTPLR